MQPLQFSHGPGVKLRIEQFCLCKQVVAPQVDRTDDSTPIFLYRIGDSQKSPLETDHIVDTLEDSSGLVVITVENGLGLKPDLNSKCGSGVLTNSMVPTPK